ncbi:MAG: PAS domain S-box protein [Opitutaceae bacterium]|nr:PAS domain S-box protein [Opitutaceae bacterium]
MPATLSAPDANFVAKTTLDAWLGAWETSADAAYCRDQEGRILTTNLSFARKFGRTPAAIAETRLEELIHPDDLGTLQKSTAEILRAPHRGAAEHRWRTPQGVRWFSWDEVALRDESGAIVAIRAVGRDITRQRLAEEQYFRLSRAVEQSPVSIVITDLDGRAQYVNSKFTVVTGRTLEDMIDHGAEPLRAGHLNEASYQACLERVRAGGEWRGEFCVTRADGSTIWESVKISCLRNASGEIANLLCLREDFTERKRLEHELRQAQKMESLGTLAGGIAHDFNNLLAIINGYAEFCAQSLDEPAVMRKSLREIHNAAQRAGSLVRQILTFSRKTEISFAPVDFNQQIRDLLRMFAETFPRNVTVCLDLLEGMPHLLGDQSQLQQILLNLCVNARDAMPEGGALTLTTRTVPGASITHLGATAGRTYACLSVDDTGTGMSPEVRARIFEPFFTTKAGNQGTGLGLAVVYGIVVAHRGCIEVESEPGEGSTFRVYLPVAESAAANTTPPIPEICPRGRESILIVDDEEALRTLLSRALAQKGYAITTAATGLEAINFLSDPARIFDAMLLDLNMPGATGVEVLRAMRICRPGLKVIVVSGHLTHEASMEFEHHGAHTFIQKPYKLDQVSRQLRSLLDTPVAE